QIWEPVDDLIRPDNLDIETFDTLAKYHADEVTSADHTQELSLNGLPQAYINASEPMPKRQELKSVLALNRWRLAPNALIFNSTNEPLKAKLPSVFDKRSS